MKFLKGFLFHNLILFLLKKINEGSSFFFIHGFILNFLSYMPGIRLSQLFFVTGTDKYTQYKFLYDNVLQGLINRKKLINY